jgi:mitochondrial inner membrane protease subunit 1
MAPTVLPGELLVAVSPRELRRGDVVLVEHPDRPGYEMVKRLTGLPEDVVEGRRLGPGECWILGDAPDASTDSRAFGPVHREAIRGVVVFRYWPRARIGRIGPGRA